MKKIAIPIIFGVIFLVFAVGLGMNSSIDISDESSQDQGSDQSSQDQNSNQFVQRDLYQEHIDANFATENTENIESDFIYVIPDLCKFETCPATENTENIESDSPLDFFSQFFVSDNITEVAYDPIPEYVNTQYIGKYNVHLAILQGLQMWNDADSTYEYVLVEDRADLYIEWSKDLGSEMDGYQEGNVIVIELGSYDCKGSWNMYSRNYLADTIAHETGHYVGLGHTIDKSHLMYGDDEFTQIPFDDLGLNIPKRIQPEVEWADAIPIKSQLDRYGSLVGYSNAVIAEYNQLVRQYNCFIGEN